MIKVELPGLFDAAWCARTARSLDERGFRGADRDYPTTYRTNERWVGEAPELAAEVFARLAPHLPAELTDASGERWRLVGLDERMRACRYRAGQSFGVHRDGVFWRSARERSHLSVLVYLDDGFEGGDTRFFQDRRARERVSTIIPAVGKAAFFDHALWHDGAPVVAGTKRVLRSDVMYRRAETRAVGHLGYVWSLAAMGPLLVSGGRDRTLRIWRDGHPIAVREGAHEASVTCLAAGPPGELVSGSRDRTLAWWRWTGEALEPIARVEAHAGAVLSVAWSGDRVLSAGADGAIAEHAIHALRFRAALHESWCWGVAPLDGDRHASIGDDGRAVLGSRGRVLATRTFGVPLRALAVLGADRLAIGALDGTIAIVRAADLAVVRTWRAHDAPITCLAALGDGVASGAEDDRVRVWTDDGRPRGERLHGDFVRAVCLYEGRVMSAGYDGAIRGEPIGG